MSLKVNNQTIQHVCKSEEELLSHQYITETLSIYKEEHCYLESAMWNSHELVGRFRVEQYPFTKDKYINYVTAGMLMLYLSQLGYIYFRGLCESIPLHSDINITTQEFFRLRDKGNIVFFTLKNIKFHRKIDISESPIEIRMELKRKVVLNGIQIGNITFRVVDNACVGEMQGAIIPDEMK